MKIFTISTLLFFSVIGFGQDACQTLLGEAFGTDEPPGCFICYGDFYGETDGKTPDSLTYDFPCGTIESSQWFSLTANQNESINLRLSYTFCKRNKGIEAAIYDQDFNLVSNCGSLDASLNYIDIIAENLIEGNVYHLMIDAIEGDECTFTVDFLTDLTPAVPFLSFGNDVEFLDQDLCVGDEFCYSIPKLKYALTYEWDIGTDLELLSGGGLKDTFACFKIVDINDTGFFIDPSHPCLRGDLFFVLLLIDHPQINITDRICENECYIYRDSCYTSEGVYSIFVNNSNDCDSLIVLRLNYDDFFPSPIIECLDLEDRIFIKWNQQSGVKENVIFVNRDSVTTTSDNYIYIEDIPIGVPIDIKVQPIGTCTYLPGEISCRARTTWIQDDYNENKISIFPNPTSGSITIETDLGVQEIEIYDATGRFLQKEETTSFDLKNRASGIYFLKIKTNLGVAIKRVILN